MKKILLCFACLGMITLVSCGDKKEKISMTPETTTISGDLSEYFEVVDEECSVKLKDGQLEPFATWRVKLRRTDAELPFAEGATVACYGSTYVDGRSYYHAGFGIEIFDEEGYTLYESKATGAGLSGPYSCDDVEELFKLKPGEEGTIRWTVDNKLLDSETALKFRISSAYETVGDPTAVGVEPAEVGNAGIDAMLDEVDRMIGRLAKMEWLSDEYEVLEKQILNQMEKIEKMKLTTEQNKRFDKLEDKFMKH